MFSSLVPLLFLSLLHPLVGARTFHSLEELHAAEQAQRSVGEQRLARRNEPYQQWQPGVHSKMQMILSGVLDMNATVELFPADSEVFDIDLFDNNSTRIDALKAKGKKVMCYFSAGTAEDWRPDNKKFLPNMTGEALPLWPGERWLNIRDPAVLAVMFERIRLAWAVGCDAVDPDNMDGYGNESGGGFNPPLKAEDSIRYLRNMAFVAHLYGIGIGLKNAEEILPQVDDVVEFVVNEQCMTYNRTCSQYESFVNGRSPMVPPKPVYHVEYVTRYNGTRPAVPVQKRWNWPILGPLSRPRVHARQLTPVTVDVLGEQIMSTDFPNITSPVDIRNKYCIQENPGLASRMNTIIKTMILDGWVLYCNGEIRETALVNRGSKDRAHPEAPGGVNIIPTTPTNDTSAAATTSTTAATDAAATGATAATVSIATNEAERDEDESEVIDQALVPIFSGISQDDAEEQIIQSFNQAARQGIAASLIASLTGGRDDDRRAVVARAPLDTLAILNAPFAPLPPSYQAYEKETNALIAAFTAKQSKDGVQTFRGSAAKDVIPSRKWILQKRGL